MLYVCVVYVCVCVYMYVLYVYVCACATMHSGVIPSDHLPSYSLPIWTLHNRHPYSKNITNWNAHVDLMSAGAQ